MVVIKGGLILYEENVLMQGRSTSSPPKPIIVLSNVTHPHTFTGRVAITAHVLHLHEVIVEDAYERGYVWGIMLHHLT